MNAARDLFTDTPPAEKPAADVQVQHRKSTGRTTGPQERERIAPAGRVGGNESAPQAPAVTGSAGPDGPQQPAALSSCGTCREWTERATGFGNCTWLPHWTTMSPRAACHFVEATRWRPIDAASIARREAQRGIDQAADAADRHYPDWTSRAFDFIKIFAEQHKGKTFIGAEIVAASHMTDLPQPPNPKAWGRPIQRAARAGVIVKAGHAPDPARHGNPVPLWSAPC